MQTKPLLYGLVGFFIGGFIVAVAATTFDKPSDKTMDHMSASLENKRGGDFDKAFMQRMITHHEDAVTMARLAARNAKHKEIKQLADAIIAAQEKEVHQMQRWQKDWGYSDE